MGFRGARAALHRRPTRRQRERPHRMGGWLRLGALGSGFMFSKWRGCAFVLLLGHPVFPNGSALFTPLGTASGADHPQNPADQVKAVPCGLVAVRSSPPRARWCLRTSSTPRSRCPTGGLHGLFVLIRSDFFSLPLPGGMRRCRGRPTHSMGMGHKWRTSCGSHLAVFTRLIGDFRHFADRRSSSTASRRRPCEPVRSAKSQRYNGVNSSVEPVCPDGLSFAQ